jgi:hypothetical protein
MKFKKVFSMRPVLFGQIVTYTKPADRQIVFADPRDKAAVRLDDSTGRAGTIKNQFGVESRFETSEDGTTVTLDTDLDNYDFQSQYSVMEILSRGIDHTRRTTHGPQTNLWWQAPSASRLIARAIDAYNSRQDAEYRQGDAASPRVKDHMNYHIDGY